MYLKYNIYDNNISYYHVLTNISLWKNPNTVVRNVKVLQIEPRAKSDHRAHTLDPITIIG